MNTLRKHPFLALLPALVVMGLPAFFVGPALDDWCTTQPIRDFQATMLLPGLFWRPFEVLLRTLAGYHTDLHPFLFHLLAVAGHLGAAVVLLSIGNRLRPGAMLPLAAAMLFVVAPGGAAAVWSVDSAIQTCSTALGLLSVYLMITAVEPCRVVAAFSAAALAVLCKESGIAWFVAAPLFAMAATNRPVIQSERRSRPHAIHLALGLLLAVVYLIFRNLLADSGSMGTNEGRYALQFDPVVWVNNAAMLLGSAFTFVDTVALFGTGQIAWALLSGLIALPLLLLAFLQILRPLVLRRLIPALIGVGAVLSPHLPLGQVSEMYAHPVIAAGVLAFLVVAPTELVRPRLFSWAYALALAVGIAVGAHKWSHMRDTAQHANSVAIQLVQAYGAPDAIPEEVCSVASNENAGQGYSVFFAGPPAASGWGRSVWALTNWQRPGKFQVVRHAVDCPRSIRHVWMVETDGTVTFLRRDAP